MSVSLGGLTWVYDLRSCVSTESLLELSAESMDTCSDTEEQGMQRS